MLVLSRRLLILLDVLNWIAVAGLAGWALTLALGSPGAERFLHRVTAPEGVEPLRRYLIAMVLVIGGGMAFAVDLIFRRLLAILDTVIRDRPFVPANGRRLRTIAWALLAIQLLDIAFALIVRGVHRLAPSAPVAWSPSATGWIAVLLLFVLAEVFARGAALQDDLEGTV